MATATMDPSSTITYTLTDVTGNDHQRVDDGIRNPTTTGFDSTRCIWSASDDNEEIELGLSGGSIASGDLITSVEINSYINQSIASTVLVRFRSGGVLTSTSNLATGGTGYQWRQNTIGSLSITYGGSASVLMAPGAIAKGESLLLEEIYVVVTFTPAGGGGGGNNSGAAGLLLGLGTWEDED